MLFFLFSFSLFQLLTAGALLFLCSRSEDIFLKAACGKNGVVVAAAAPATPAARVAPPTAAAATPRAAAATPRSVPPPSQASSQKVVTAVYAFEPQEPGELRFRKVWDFFLPCTTKLICFFFCLTLGRLNHCHGHVGCQLVERFVGFPFIFSLNFWFDLLVFPFVCVV